MVTKKEVLSKEVEQIDLERVKDVRGLLKSFERSSMQSRNLGKCLQVYENCLRDPDRPFIFLGLAGAMMAGGMRKVIRDMIEYNLVDCLVSTGGNLYQDFALATGTKFYMGTPYADDVLLRKLYINRIYDTYVDEAAFDTTDKAICAIADKLPKRAYSSSEFLKILGKKLKDKNSILYTAAQHGIPVICPALNDSSIGIALTMHYYWNRKHIVIDSILDNYEITQIVMNPAPMSRGGVKTKKTAVVYVSGGYPKNFIQQATVTLESLEIVPRGQTKGHDYAIQLTADAPHWGGLSGCTLEEAQSWGKVAKRAKKATTYIDSTIGLPLLIGAILQGKAYKKRKRLKFNWRNHRLVSLKEE
jgi:deoxyhypusine synthase